MHCSPDISLARHAREGAPARLSLSMRARAVSIRPAGASVAGAYERHSCEPRAAPLIEYVGTKYIDIDDFILRNII